MNISWRGLFGGLVFGLYLIPGFLFSAEFSQKSLSVNITQIETQNFPQVLLYTLIEDADGIPIENLTAKDISISEFLNGTNQAIEATDISLKKSGKVQRGVSIALIYDSSGSMWGRLPKIKKATKTLFNAMSQNDRAAIITFSSTVNVIQPFVGKTIDTDKNGILDLEESVNAYQTKGKTALYDALDKGITLLSQESGVKAVVVFADGEDNNSATTKYELIQRAIRAQIPIYTIGLGLKLNPAPLKEIARRTSGLYYSAPSISNIQNVYLSFFKSVSRLYEIAYRTPLDQFDGSSRKISLGIKGYHLKQQTSLKEYTVVSAPEISRHASMLKYDQPGFQQTFAKPIDIRALVKTDAPPNQLRVTLFYRSIASKKSFSQIQMQQQENVFYATIPSANVSDPGIEYYLLAFDGKLTATSPKKGAIFGQTYQIAVDPNFAPVIEHVPSKLIEPKRGFKIVAEVTDQTKSVDTVKLFYRKAGIFHYTSLEMFLEVPHQYSAVIPLAEITTKGVQYYISAWDDSGVRSDSGSADKPYLIKASAPVISIPTQTLKFDDPDYFHDPGYPIQIDIQIKSDVTNDLIQTYLHYRKHSKADIAFTRKLMQFDKSIKTSSAFIPTQSIGKEGMDYFVTAFDGLINVRYPSMADSKNITKTIRVRKKNIKNPLIILVKTRPEIIPVEKSPKIILVKTRPKIILVKTRSKIIPVKKRPKIIPIKKRPSIVLSQATQLLSQPGYRHNPLQAIKIQLKIAGGSSYEKLKTRLYYRNVGNSKDSFTEIQMYSVKKLGIFSESIPSSKLTGKRLEYYVTVSYLSSNKAETPTIHVIQLLQKVDPVIDHQYKKAAVLGELATLNVKIKAPEPKQFKVFLNYRRPYHKVFTSTQMEFGADNQYKTIFPVAELTSAGMEYFIAVFDSQGKIYYHGTNHFPHNTIGIEMVFIKGDCFRMGDTFHLGTKMEKPTHTVCVDDFYLGKYEVDQKLWMRFVNRENPSYHKNSLDFPVENVSWKDIQNFIKQLNRGREKQFRLPTEAEWEYACKSGSENLFSLRYKNSHIKDLGHSLANYDGMEHLDQWNGTAPVGSFPTNLFGLHDMSGNVWEWVLDTHEKYTKSAKRIDNPIYNKPGADRIIRGGGWLDTPLELRCSNREHVPDTYKSRFIGFRLFLQM